VVQQGLGNGGYASGYFLNKSSIAVLSLPSFDMDGIFAVSFQQFVKDFLQRSRTAGMKKLVIDLQGNGGGSVFDGYELFTQVSSTSPRHHLNVTY
jgi:C-terminal processing protease CtpA/Prc